MSRKKKSKASSPPSRSALAERSRKRFAAALAGVAVLGALALAVAWHQGRLSPAPGVVTPAAPELLDPAVRRLVDRMAAEARETPRDPRSHARLGILYEANSLWREAHQAYARAAELEPANRAWRLHLAITAQQAGDLAAALEGYRRLAKEHPSYAPAQQRLGLALLETGELEEALAAFQRVQDALPGAAAGFEGAGTALRLLGRPDAAAERLERALALDSASRSARYQLGLVYRDLDRPGDAERALLGGLSATIGFLPDELSEEIDSYAVSLPAVVARAETLRKTGRHGEAAALLERAVATHPDDPGLLNNLATAHLAQGELDRSRSVLERALAAGGDNAETLLNLAGWALASERPGEALDYADRAIAMNPRLAPPHGVKAQALVKLRRYPEATASMEQALRLEVRDPAVFLGLGVLYEAAGRWSDARALYERALERWPDLVPAHVGRCAAALALDDRDAATEALAAVRRLEPDHPRLAALRRSLESP